MTLPRTVLQCSWLQRESFWLQKLWNEILKKKWKLSSYCCSTDATFINLTLQQTSTEHKNKNILWWTCVHTEDITIKCIFISAILNLSLRGQHNHYQSHKLQQSKWHLWLKNHALHWMDKEMYEAVFTREKGCFVALRPLESDVHVQPTFCLFANWISS